MTTLRLSERHDFLVLATDGVWGAMDAAPGGPDAILGAERVACMVAEARAASPSISPGEVADLIVARADAEDGSDNASCVVVFLN